jgi:hypothetical protein
MSAQAALEHRPVDAAAGPEGARLVRQENPFRKVHDTLSAVTQQAKNPQTLQKCQ